MDKKELSFFKNGASLGQAFRSIPAGKWYIANLSFLRSKANYLRIAPSCLANTPGTQRLDGVRERKRW
jgi:hypothetical protein